MIEKVKNTVFNAPMEKVFNLLLALLMILSTHTVLSESSNYSIQSNLNKVIILIAAALLIFTVSTLYNEKIDIRNIAKIELIYALAILILCIAQTAGGTFVYNDSWVIAAWFVLLIIPTVYLQIIKHELIILEYFKKIMIVLSVISLVFWILSILHVPTTSTTTISWGGIKTLDGYFGIHYLAQAPVHFFGINMMRNTGIFTEAPMFSAALSIAFLIHLFIDNKKIDKITCLLVVTIISTTSTTGIIIILGALFLKLAKRYMHISKYILIGLLLSATIIMYLIFQSKMKNMSGSYNTRINDIYAGFKTWMQHPIFGNGLGDNFVIKQNMSPMRTMYAWSNSGFSSGIFSMLVQGGLYYFLLLFIIPTVAFARKNINNLFCVLLIAALLFVSIINDTFIFVFLMVFMLISGLGEFKE